MYLKVLKMPRRREVYSRGIVILVGLYLIGIIYLNFSQSWKEKQNIDYKNKYLDNKVLATFVPRITEAFKRAMIHDNNGNLHKYNDTYVTPNDLYPKEFLNIIAKNDFRFDIYKQPIMYNNFTLAEPHFISPESKDLFQMKHENINHIGVQPERALTGVVYIVKNGIFDTSKDCGYRSNLNWIIQNNNTDRNARWFHALAPIVVPDGHTFQHFLDGTLPKVIQALPVLKNHPSVKILMKPPRDTIIYEIFEKLNISKERIVHPDGNSVVGADLMVFTCIAPPIHPTLWRMARRLMGAPEVLPVPISKGYIVIVTRKGCHNCGRNIVNMDSLADMLRQRYTDEMVKIFNGSAGLQASIDMFGRARIVIGPHGGGMYNINFSPINTTVIEFMPTKTNGDMIAGAANIIWTQAILLGQEFWRVSVPPTNKQGDMLINLNEVIEILTTVDKMRTYQTG